MTHTGLWSSTRSLLRPREGSVFDGLGIQSVQSVNLSGVDELGNTQVTGVYSEAWQSQSAFPVHPADFWLP